MTLRQVAVLHQIALWLYTIAWTVMLIVPDPLTFLGFRDIPEDLGPETIPADKIVHVTGYLLLALLAGWAFAGSAKPSRLFWIWIACVAHGAVTEWVQANMPERVASWRDWLADAGGSAIGVGFWMFVWRGRRPPSGGHERGH